METTASLYNCVVEFFRRVSKKKDWDGRVLIRMGFGKRGKNQLPITEDDLLNDQFLFSQTSLDSPASKTTAREKRIESNMDPLEVRAYIRKVYFDDDPSNPYHFGFTV